MNNYADLWKDLWAKYFEFRESIDSDYGPIGICGFINCWSARLKIDRWTDNRFRDPVTLRFGADALRSTSDKKKAELMDFAEKAQEVIQRFMLDNLVLIEPWLPWWWGRCFVGMQERATFAAFMAALTWKEALELTGVKDEH